MDGKLPGQGIPEVSGKDPVKGSVGFVLQGLKTHRLRITGLTMGSISYPFGWSLSGRPPT